MIPQETALILVGYQNDYFSPRGSLHSVIEDPHRLEEILENTLRVVERLAETAATLITTPILFTPGYSELCEPVGILKAIQEAGAFQAGSPGAETIPELRRFGDRLLEVPGKRGLNAFSNTQLDGVLRARKIKDVAVCGVVASICIDSTGRGAFERGYRVSLLSDCISGRTRVEEEFYLAKIYPLYARVMSGGEFLSMIASGNCPQQGVP